MRRIHASSSATKTCGAIRAIRLAWSARPAQATGVRGPGLAADHAGAARRAADVVAVAAPHDRAIRGVCECHDHEPDSRNRERACAVHQREQDAERTARAEHLE